MESSHVQNTKQIFIGQAHVMESCEKIRDVGNMPKFTLKHHKNFQRTISGFSESTFFPNQFFWKKMPADSIVSLEETIIPVHTPGPPEEKKLKCKMVGGDAEPSGVPAIVEPFRHGVTATRISHKKARKQPMMTPKCFCRGRHGVYGGNLWQARRRRQQMDCPAFQTALSHWLRPCRSSTGIVDPKRPCASRGSARSKGLGCEKFTKYFSCHRNWCVKFTKIITKYCAPTQNSQISGKSLTTVETSFPMCGKSDHVPTIIRSLSDTTLTNWIFFHTKNNNCSTATQCTFPVLQSPNPVPRSISPVPLFATTYFSSTTPDYTVLVQLYFVIQSNI